MTGNALDFVMRNGDPVFPVIAPDENIKKPLDWLSKHKDWLMTTLSEKGAVLLRGFDIHAVSDFNKFSLSFSPNLLAYNNRSTPRTSLGGKVYTSTEYPSDKIIPQHNENSYANNWPGYLIFFSVISATEGGQTPLADSQRILSNLAPSLIERFEKHGVLYVRNYQKGIDLPWVEVFQTDSKEEVEAYCTKNNIHFEWFENGEKLRTKQVVQATTIHPKTGVKVWFNQANLFHVSATSAGQALIQELGIENVPRNTYFGDGSEIPVDYLQEIDAVIAAEKFSFKWNNGDILIIDNLLMTHGRNAYKGDRKLVVTMAPS